MVATTMTASTVLDDTKAPKIDRIWQSEGNVLISFTEDLAPASVTADAVSIVRNALPVAGTTTLSDSRTLQFAPSQPLIEDGSYSLTVSQILADLSGQYPMSSVSPVLFQFSPLPVAFYTKADQRQERSTSAYKNFHLFQGRELDQETELLYFRNRWLDPALWTWTSLDPMKYVNGVVSLYNTIKRDPINLVDPPGLWETDIHYYAVFYLAIKAGYDLGDAEDIAWASQYVDDSKYSQPTVGKAAQPWMRKRIAAFHFIAPKDEVVVPNSNYARFAVGEAMESEDAIRFGISIHAFADTFSHAGYSAYYDSGINARPERSFNIFDVAPFFNSSHVPIGHGEAGHDPDMPYLHQDSAFAACKEMYDYLKQYSINLYDPPRMAKELSSFESEIKDILSKNLPTLEWRINEWEKAIGRITLAGYVPHYGPEQGWSKKRKDWQKYAEQHYDFVMGMFK